MSISLDPPLDTDLDLISDECPAENTEGLGTEVLVAIAAGLAEVSSPWDLRPGESAHDRHYERVLATPSYEAWIIYWPAGTALDLHDHGDSAGAFAVVAGRLDESRVTAGGPEVNQLRAGEVTSFDRGQVHGVANTGAIGATSVHVYSPPISAMTYFARLSDGSVISVRRDAGEWAPTA
jgi:quercetin dioxygenase-like cupin family protein